MVSIDTFASVNLASLLVQFQSILLQIEPNLESVLHVLALHRLAGSNPKFIPEFPSERSP
jgi:hypothetical protein